MSEHADELAEALTLEQRKLLQEAYNAHDAANAACGVGDPYPYDMRAQALIEAYELTDGPELKTWGEVHAALAGGSDG